MPKKFVPGILLLVVIPLFSLSLSACGEVFTSPQATPIPSITSARTTAETNKPPVTITWSFWGDDAEQAVIKKLIDQFERLNSHIKIKPLYEKWENYFTRLETEWVGDKAPDVMFLSFIPNYASKGMLESIEPFVTNEKNLDLNDFYPNLLQAFRYNNALFGLPRDNDTKVIYVNLKMFREAGLSIPKAGYTWQDLRDIAAKLTRRDTSGNFTQYGFAFEPNYWWQLWIWQNGGEIYDSFTSPEPPKKALLDSPEASGAIQYFADLINKDKVTPPYEGMDTSREITQLFQEGKLAMAFGGHGKVPAFASTPGLEWDVVPLPVGKKRVNVSGGAGYAIHKNSKFKAESWELVKFLTSELGQSFFMETGLVVPSRQSIREDNIFVRNVKYNWQVFNEESKYGQRVPQFRSSNDLIKFVDTELVPVWKGQQSAAQVMGKLPEKMLPLLSAIKT